MSEVMFEAYRNPLPYASPTTELWEGKGALSHN